MTTVLSELFLQLVRMGIGHADNNDNPDVSGNVDWTAMLALAERQGLSAVLADGIERLPKEVRPSKLEMLQLIGQVMQNYEHRHKLYLQAIAELAGVYNSHGFKMMVLKGYACALDWPKPEHRPSGDIDIWLFGKQKAADAVLLNLNANDNLGSPEGSKSDKNFSKNHIEIDNSHHHHTVFHWRDFMVENHYDFINVHHHRSNAEYEKILKKLGEASHVNDNENDNVGTRIPWVELYGERVYLPSPDLHALFLLKHMMLHFASGEISLRQVLDWGFFVKAHGNEVDWEYVTGVLEEFGMMEMFGLFNAICVEELGFQPVDSLKLIVESQLGSREFKALKERVLSEILSPEFTGKTPSALIPRVVFKYRRWRANEWKHSLCFKESMWSAFWSGVWNHLLKPRSI